MNRRLPAFISTISNSFCDFTLDFAVNKYKMKLQLILDITFSIFHFFNNDD